MKKTNSTKKAMFGSAISLLLCFAMLLGATFAWFTDNVTSTNNRIVSGDLDIDLLMDKTGNGEYESIADGIGDIFNEEAGGNGFNWEPGKTEIVYLAVRNTGTLALKYNIILDIVDAGLVGSLEYALIDGAKAADLLETEKWTDIKNDSRAQTGNVAAGQIVVAPNGRLGAIALTGEENETDYFAIAVHMKEEAGNEYEEKSITIDLKLIATQVEAENDSFGNGYDTDATLNYYPASSEAELRAAIANENEAIVLTSNVATTEPLTIDYDVTINGNGYRLTRTDMAATMSRDASTPTVYKGVMIEVAAGQTLTLENVIIDGGAIWTGEVNQTLKRGTVNEGVVATGALVTVADNATIVLGKGAVLQNNDGANAVNIGAKSGKLVVNGGEIINNHSAAGAIWGNGKITLNSGKISYNHGGIGGAIRAVTNVGTLLEMNGGEMNNNYSDGNGGAIWAGSSRSNNVYVLNGGEMAYNYSATTGGAIYAGYYETVKIGGTFKMHDNDCVENIGSAIRFHNHASLVMTGGEIYNHDENAFYLNNNSASITGGKYVGNFDYSGGLGLTWGNATVDGVINYKLDTNHKTAYLAKEFGTLQFTVPDSHVATFNFQPATDYVYTAGDEAKLICKNAGYTTYWDETTSTFRLKAN